MVDSCLVVLAVVYFTAAAAVGTVCWLMMDLMTIPSSFSQVKVLDTFSSFSDWLWFLANFSVDSFPIFAVAWLYYPVYFTVKRLSIDGEVCFPFLSLCLFVSSSIAEFRI